VQGTATALLTLGGLLLSLACAVLLEELLVGGLFRLFFAPRPGAGGSTPPTAKAAVGGGAGQKRGSEQVR